MRRREFIAGLGAAAWPRAAGAQQQTLSVVGLLSSASPDRYSHYLQAFREGLGDTGHVEGRNVAIEYQWADGNNDRLPALAADLVGRQVRAIAALGSTPAALAAKAATATIPIVFQVGSDPIAAGLVASLARPGGNVTGVTNLNTELGRKRLELLRELAPAAKAVVLLVNPTSPLIAQTMSQDLEAAAHTLGLQLHILPASTEQDFDAVFARLAALKAEGLVIAPDAFFITRSEQLAALTVRHAVPAIAQFREFAAGGGLMSYGGNFSEAAHQVGVFIGRILRGEKPADLPVRQLTKVALVINLRTANAIGVAIPQSLLARADEVIE